MTIKDNKPDLLECPRCNNKKIWTLQSFQENIHYAECRHCYHKGPMADNEIDAITGWNNETKKENIFTITECKDIINNVTTKLVKDNGIEQNDLETVIDICPIFVYELIRAGAKEALLNTLVEEGQARGDYDNEDYIAGWVEGPNEYDMYTAYIDYEKPDMTDEHGGAIECHGDSLEEAMHRRELALNGLNRK